MELTEDEVAKQWQVVGDTRLGMDSEVSQDMLSEEADVEDNNSAFVAATPSESEEEEEEEIQLPPKKRFRINARQLFLTYPKCPLDKETALLKVTEITGSPKDYIVAREKHKVGYRQNKPSSILYPQFLSATAFIANTTNQNNAFFEYKEKQFVSQMANLNI